MSAVLTGRTKDVHAASGSIASNVDGRLDVFIPIALAQVFRSREASDMTDDNLTWDANAIVVVPGLPGRLSAPDGDPVFPGATLAFVKIMVSEGYPVHIRPRDEIREVSHHSAEVWLPILNIGLQVLIGAGGNLLATLVALALSPVRKKKVVAHIKWNVQSSDGSTQSFEYSGDSEQAVLAARIFEKGLNGPKNDD